MLGSHLCLCVQKNIPIGAVCTEAHVDLDLLPIPDDRGCQRVCARGRLRAGHDVRYSFGRREG